MPEHRVLLRNHLGKDLTKLDEYKKLGGFGVWPKWVAQGPAAIHNEVKAANLRGRGGAGFPAGVKWGFLPNDGRPRYLVVNADEGEPGTFKDRYFLEDDPFRLIEGCLLTSYALNIHTCYIYIRGEFWRAIDVMEKAIADARKAGWLGKDIQGSGFDLEIYTHPGAGAYICGEETALIESIEGKPGQPRLKPPFPANIGLFGMPTIVNNVETLACVPVILEIGADGFNALGTPKNGGTKLVGVSGHVKKPGLFEVKLGLSLREIIYDLAGGILDDRELLGVIPGGSSCPFLTAEQVDQVTSMDFDGLKGVGSMFGTAGIVVMHDGTDLIDVLKRVTGFYRHESCGQCTPCRQGTGWLAAIVEKMDQGLADESHIDLLIDACTGIEGNTICALGEAAAWPVRSVATRFRPQLAQAIAARSAAIGS
jgi:NADH-quinone oxidoreductase subunit F